MSTTAPAVVSSPSPRSVDMPEQFKQVVVRLSFDSPPILMAFPEATGWTIGGADADYVTVYSGEDVLAQFRSWLAVYWS